MKFFQIAVLAVMTTSVAALGQQQRQDWIPQGVESLGQNASSRTEFALDHSMLVFASKLDQDDDNLRRVIAGVDGISVRSYSFPRPGMYDSGILSSVRQQYHEAGWRHMVNTHNNNKDGNSGATDLWIRYENNTVRNVAVLFAGRNHLNFIAVSGSISPLDLSHLAGHFGIPRMEGGVLVPVPDSER
jgi:hypothetical protein